jgi:hypothetical protein
MKTAELFHGEGLKGASEIQVEKEVRKARMECGIKYVSGTCDTEEATGSYLSLLSL